MPQNTPMKRQFITIDGRTVMSNLPQHWGGNDWKITGVDNPLPVGNYVQTEAGVWIPQKGSDDGAADVRITGSRVDYQNIFERKIRTETEDIFTIVPDDAIGAIIQLSIYGITGNVSGGGLSLRVRNFATSKSFHSRTQISDMITDKQTSPFACNVIIYPIPSIAVNTYAFNPPTVHDSILGDRLRIYCIVEGDFGPGEGIDCEGNIQWLKR